MVLKLVEFPVLRRFNTEAEVKGLADRASDHINYLVTDIVVKKNLRALRIDNVTLLVHNVVVGKDVLSSLEVVALDPHLCVTDRV